MEQTHRGLLLIISGPSGAGKTTIARQIEAKLNGVFSVSVTTRPKAPKDVEGRDYYFVDEPTFQRMRRADEFLEYAKVFGHYYGTPRRPVTDAIEGGRLMILEIDVQGAIQLKGKLDETFAVFVMPPSEEALLHRLRGRGRDDEQVIQQRFAEACREIQQAKDSGVYDRFVTNSDLDAAVAETIAAVQQRMEQSAV